MAISPVFTSINASKAPIKAQKTEAEDITRNRVEIISHKLFDAHLADNHSLPKSAMFKGYQLQQKALTGEIRVFFSVTRNVELNVFWGKACKKIETFCFFDKVVIDPRFVKSIEDLRSCSKKDFFALC